MTKSLPFVRKVTTKEEKLKRIEECTKKTKVSDKPAKGAKLKR